MGASSYDNRWGQLSPEAARPAARPAMHVVVTTPSTSDDMPNGRPLAAGEPVARATYGSLTLPSVFDVPRTGARGAGDGRSARPRLPATSRHREAAGAGASDAAPGRGRDVRSAAADDRMVAGSRAGRDAGVSDIRMARGAGTPSARAVRGSLALVRPARGGSYGVPGMAAAPAGRAGGPGDGSEGGSSVRGGRAAGMGFGGRAERATRGGRAGRTATVEAFEGSDVRGDTGGRFSSSRRGHGGRVRAGSAVGSQARGAADGAAFGMRGEAAFGPDVAGVSAVSTYGANDSDRPGDAFSADGMGVAGGTYAAGARARGRAGSNRVASGADRLWGAGTSSPEVRADASGAAVITFDRPARARGAASQEVGSRVYDALNGAVSAAEDAVGLVAAHRALVATVVSVALVLAFLYPPVKSYYVATRVHAALSSQLDGVNSANDSLQGEVDALMTKEGIEDEARKRGYVKEGEAAVTMSGVDEASDESASSDATGDTAADEPWYVHVLDVVFQYDPSSQGVS